MTTFCKNLKRFRLSKNMTQEQAAQSLGVSPQSVSRWECGTTFPDVSMLPAIARLYCVTIDDLYRESSVAYDNYAQRLGSIFEDTREPEDYIRADMEYKKLLRSGAYTTEDLRLYGILHQQMMQVCMERAEEIFRRIIQKGPEEHPETYWSVKRQKGYFLWTIGRNQENIDEFLPLVEAGSNELQEWICLIQSLDFAQRYEEAWTWAQRAAVKFPESATLHIYTGDLLRSMKRYEEAFPHWKRAMEMEPDWCDAAYSMGFTYEELGEYANAVQIWEGIADNLIRRGFEAEVNYPRELARKCREKMSR